MMSQMVFHETRNEKVAVIVAGMPPQLQVMTGRAGGFFEHFRVELIGEELVGGALVDENRAVELAPAHQFAGVPFLPRLAVRPQIGGESLDSPWAPHRRRNRREGR